MYRTTRPPHNYGGTAFGQSPFPLPPEKKTPFVRQTNRKSGISPFAKALWEESANRFAPSPSFRKVTGQKASDDPSPNEYPLRPYSLGARARRVTAKEEEESESETKEDAPRRSLFDFSEDALLLALFFCLAKEDADPILLLSLGYLLLYGIVPIPPLF